jgi:trimethylamine---corrinoid protein Co-methyltransferase
VVSMPLAGGTSPVTLAGTLVQLAAETLSGFALAQCVRPGAPVLWGGVPTILDMREGTTPAGAVESLMMNCAFNEIGKLLRLPTHCYLGNSDAKTVDGQAAYESALGLMLAALSRSNLNAGAGMLSFINCQSLEDLIIDHELIGMARRLARGIDTDDESLGAAIIREVGHGGDFLSTAHTVARFRREFFVPRLASRESEAGWARNGASEIRQRARERLRELLPAHRPSSLADGQAQALDEIMLRAAREHGMEELPRG